MWSLVAVEHLLKKHILRKVPRALQDVAVRSWEIAPGETSTVPPAIFLPGQLDRVTGWAFIREHPAYAMAGGFTAGHAPTRGFLLENAWLIDGTLYKDDACSYLLRRSRPWPRIRIDREIDRAAVYCTAGGSIYFGQWLIDDCVTYPLAAAEGVPVTTGQSISPHTRGYGDALDMKPERVETAFLRQAVVFEDYGQNRNKHARFRAQSQKLISQVDARPHPGVFILRRRSGERRILRNEMELAEYLRDRRGFRIIDPMGMDVRTIMTTCAGARVVAGVEGSHLIHGILFLPEGGSVFTVQPPSRFCTIFKDLTDRDHQHFGFVVGIPDGRDFRVDLDEVERTLDLLPS